VCEAIHHAHQKGIIHRDIKPSNVLVSNQEGKAILKVIDFGVAKAISRHLTEKTLFTEQGQLVGTPEYMSPEQAELTNQDIDTRTDIYSLGVLLYELLTGALPFDPKTLRKAAFSEIQRIIREEEPPKPSTRLSSLGNEAESIAKTRKTETSSLIRRLHKELEWIPLMAIRKERDRRYRTATELADDVCNYLRGEVLLAGPESAIYRIKKTVRRHRALVTGIAAVVTVLALGLVVTTYLYLVAETQRAKANKARASETLELYFNRIFRVEREIKDGNINQAQMILGRCPNDLRCWEWGWLKHLSERNAETFVDTEGHPKCAFYASNEITIASSGPEGSVRIWDARTGQERLVLGNLPTSASSIAFSSDGKRIAAAYREEVRVWDANTGNELLALGQESRYSGSENVALSSDGRYVAANLGSGTMIWDVSTKKELATLGSPGHCWSIEFSPCGKKVAFASGSFGIWDIGSARQVAKFLSKTGSIACISFSPEGRLIAAGDSENNVRVWDTETGRLMQTLNGHQGPVLSISFSTDANMIASAAGDDSFTIPDTTAEILFNMDRSIRIWDVATGEPIMILKGHEGPVISVTFSPDGSHLASVSDDCTVKVWDIRPKPELLVPATPTGLPLSRSMSDTMITFLAFAPDDDSVVATTTNGASVIDVTKGGALSTRIDLHTGDLADTEPGVKTPAAISPDKERLAVVSAEGLAKIYNPRTFQQEKVFIYPDAEITGVAFAQDGASLVCVTENAVAVFDVKTRREIAALNTFPDQRFSGHAAGLGRNMLLLGTYMSPGGGLRSDGFQQLIILDIGQNEVIGTLWDCGEEAQGVLCSSADSNSIAVVNTPSDIKQIDHTTDWGLRLWGIDDVRSNRDGHDGTLIGGLMLGFSSDKRRVISTRAYRVDRVLKLTERSSGRTVLSLHAHMAPVTAAAFSSDGNHLVTGGADGAIILWRTGGVRSETTIARD